MNTPFEKRICLGICVCQLTAVLSCVSIVYLTVAVYEPSYQLLNSGFSEDTVMCTTVSNKTVPNCEVEDPDPEAPPGTMIQATWYSCGEWCLSKSTGSCVHIKVDVRKNGSNIHLEGCNQADFMYCEGIDPNPEVYECINGECEDLHGIFNCTKGTLLSPTGETTGSRCRNLTSMLSCNVTKTSNPIKCDPKKPCVLHGLYWCNEGHCGWVRRPFKCEKRCVGIKTGGKNVVIRQGDVIFTANCSQAVDVKPDNKSVIWPLDSKNNEPEMPPVLMMFCTTISDIPDEKSIFKLIDCFNASLLDKGHFGITTNITFLVQSHLEAQVFLPGENAPKMENELLIYNNTPLYINMDYCVNSLILDECAKFHDEYGGDGNDGRAQSRFQCYYDPNSSEFVVLRFSRFKSLVELIIATTIPITLAVVSCFSLVLFSRIINVGDDSHFYFQCCGADAKEAMAL